MGPQICKPTKIKGSLKSVYTFKTGAHTYLLISNVLSTESFVVEKFPHLQLHFVVQHLYHPPCYW